MGKRPYIVIFIVLLDLALRRQNIEPILVTLKIGGARFTKNYTCTFCLFFIFSHL